MVLTRQNEYSREPHLVRFRKTRQGPEADLLDHLIAEQRWVRPGAPTRVLHLIEPQIGIGFPDLIVAVFDPKNIRHRNPRFELRDLKIIQFLSSRLKPVRMTEAERKLGIPATKLRRRLARLSRMGVVRLREEQVVYLNDERLFFLDQIIAIEAKVKNWKIALHQAQMNQLFASASYVMLPEKIAMTARESFAAIGSPGLLAPSNGDIVCMKKASIYPLPQSVYSWMVNEMVRNAFRDITKEESCHV